MSSAKLARYAKDYESNNGAVVGSTGESSELHALQAETFCLGERCTKLEKENGTLAGQLLTSKTGMQAQLEKVSLHIT